jgi:hypothetical protein
VYFGNNVKNAQKKTTPQQIIVPNSSLAREEKESEKVIANVEIPKGKQLAVWLSDKTAYHFTPYSSRKMV